jgi:hypothetical protein
MAEEAAAQMAGTDMVGFQGDAQYELALLLREDGRIPEALAAARTALALHERKGSRAVGDHARALVEELVDDEFAA